MIRPADAEYIDGVKALHEKLNKASIEAYKIASSILPLTMTEKEFFEKDNSFKIYVDSSKCKSLSKFEGYIEGYFIFGNYICRFLPVSIEPATLFPVRDLTNWDKDNRKGLSAIDITKLGISDSILSFSPKSNSRVSYPLYYISMSEVTNVIDDIGLPYTNFNDIESIKIIDIPQKIINKTYSLVGTRYYAPLSNTVNNCYCVLFAELNNQYDSNAIKVLRWLPQLRADKISQHNEVIFATRTLLNIESRIKRYEKQLQNDYIPSIYTHLKNAKLKQQELNKKISESNNIGDIFFEMGHISRLDNSELHKFMIENDSRLLFGKIKNENISIIGGISSFISSEFYFPRCLTCLKIR